MAAKGIGTIKDALKLAWKTTGDTRRQTINSLDTGLATGAQNAGFLERLLGSLTSRGATVTMNEQNMALLRSVKGEAAMNKLGAGIGSDVKLSWLERQRALRMNADGTYNYGKVAADFGGAVVGLSAAYRIASGGGLYRDSSGEANIIGLPLI